MGSNVRVKESELFALLKGKSTTPNFTEGDTDWEPQTIIKKI